MTARPPPRSKPSGRTVARSSPSPGARDRRRDRLHALRPGAGRAHRGLGRGVTLPVASDETRIDRWLCAMRLVKTRPLATRLCDGGHVLVNGVPAKPSTKVRAGDRVEALIADRRRIVEVVRPIESRVGAAVAVTCYADHSPPVVPESGAGDHARPRGRPAEQAPAARAGAPAPGRRRLSARAVPAPDRRSPHQYIPCKDGRDGPARRPIDRRLCCRSARSCGSRSTGWGSSRSFRASGSLSRSGSRSSSRTTSIQYTTLGTLQVAGIVIAVLVQPTVGSLSDYTISRFGRRKPYIVVGTLLDFVFLAGLATSNTVLAVAAFVIAAPGQLERRPGSVPGLRARPRRGAAGGAGERDGRACSRSSAW